jgi:hypothetical protein
MPQIKREDKDSLESFAKRIISRLKVGGATDSLERIICRHIAGENEKVSAFMAEKVVQWRYGKAKETLQVSGMIEHEHRTIDPEKLTDAQLAEAERLIESASVGSDQG